MLSTLIQVCGFKTLFFLNTLNKVKKICVILRRSENSFSLLQWLSMRKQILKHKKMKKTYIPKIILHNYILYKGDPTYVGTFPVNLRMARIFTDLPTGSGSAPCAHQEKIVHWPPINQWTAALQYYSLFVYILQSCKTGIQLICI